MAGIARQGDLVSCICCCHPPIPCVSTIGYFVQSSLTVSGNGLGVARLGDMAICSCGHPTFLVGASTTVTANGLGVGRVGDPVSGCPVGNVITGSTDITAGG